MFSTFTQVNRGFTLVLRRSNLDFGLGGQRSWKLIGSGCSVLDRIPAPNLKPQNRRRMPRGRWHSSLETAHPTPHTLHPIPYILHRTPYTLHPKPYTTHPTPRRVFMEGGILPGRPCQHPAQAVQADSGCQRLCKRLLYYLKYRS